MAIIKSYSPFLNLSNYSTFLVDANPNSDYFRITEFKETFTGGKNGFLIEGSQYLKETTEIKIEILDVNGNPVYFEPGNGIPEYYEGISKLIAVHVYNDTPIGIGKITILGELKNYVSTNGLVLPVPQEWQGTYNVKWEREFKINRNLSNEDVVRFYKRPTITIDEIVKPIFSKTIPSVTQSGSLQGISQTPIAGTNLSNWRAGTLYRLKISDGSNWTSSVDENIITIPSLGYSGTVKEVLNNKEVLVNTPYTINNVVSDFGTTDYTTSFEYVEGQSVGGSALTGSFAKINIQQLKTFVGDVARVKVYRKSRNDIGDYAFVQESKLESTELLRDITTAGDTEISYGNFTDSNLSTYWVTSSNQHPTTIDVETLNAAVKVNYNTGIGGVQQLITSESFNISKDVEYTISFKTLLSGSLDGQKTLKAYFSSSDYQQNFLTVSGSSIYGTRQNISQNIIASKDASAKLVLEFTGDDWYVSNLSLKNAQETSFSPDEFILVQEIPRNLPIETYDFRFEFYDINNNYIPVTVNATKSFNGGNNFLASTKFLSFQSDRTAFRFSTGSYANPPYQSIHLSVQRNGLTGSVLFASAAYDMLGNYITPADYYASGVLEYGVNWPNQIQYPGGITNPSDGGGLLHIHDFSGSLDYSGSVHTIRVGSIVYTASCESSNEYETIYRFEDGDNAPNLFVTSNTNQFIYKATDLSLNPQGQSITIEAKRKNLASTTTPLTINSGSGPALTFVSDNVTTGVSTYTIAGSDYLYTYGETTYEFTGSDQFNNSFSDRVTISPVKILDGFSVSATNENTTFPAKSTGDVIGGFNASSGSIAVKIGSEVISYSNTFVSNSYSASISSYSGLTPSFNGTTYSISALSADSGSLSILVKYKDGSGTIISSSKDITYSKAKKGTPNVIVSATPQAQSVLANSTGLQTGVLTDVVVSALEGSTSQFTSMAATYSGFSTNPTISTNTLVMSSAVIDYGKTEASASIVVTHTDSDGTSGQTKNIIVRATKVTQGANGASGIVVSVTPPSQIVTRSNTGTYGTPGAISVSVVEGSTIYPYDNTIPYTSGSFYISNVVNGTNNNNKTITPTTPTTTAGITTTFDVNYTTLAGVAVTVPQTHSVSVTLDGQTGPGVVFTGVWASGRAYQFSAGAGTGRRDVVLWSASGTAPYDTYYAAIRQHTSATGNVANGAPNQSAQTGWESLGTQDFFVAAKIGLFQESYVQNTLNIGTNNNGGVSTANITLAGGTQYPYFSLGQAVQGVYNANGIYIGSDAGVYKMSLKSGTNSLSWDGTNLSINGGGTFSGALSAASGTFTGALQGGTISIGSGNSIFKADTNGIYLGNATFASAPFRVSPSGAFTANSATISGDITATALTLSAGVTISKTAVSGLGALASRDSVNATYIDDNSISTGKVIANTLNASHISGLDFTGKTAVFNQGTIGGWIINSDKLASPVDGSGYSRLTLNPSPLIAVNNTSGVPKCTIRAGDLSNLTAGTAITMTFAAVTSRSGTSAAYTTVEDVINGSGTSFSVAAGGTYSGTISYAGGTQKLYTLDSSFSGYAYEELRYQVASDSGFTTILTDGNLAGVGVSSGDAYVTNTSVGIQISFSSAGTYYSRLYWKRRFYNSSNTSITYYGVSSGTISSAVAQSADATELTDKGFQVVNSAIYYFRIKRDSGYYDTATPFVQVGGKLSATDNIIAYYSDGRLKDVEGKIENPLDKIEKLNGVYYKQNKLAEGFGFSNERRQVGLIAQEVNEVLPEVIDLAPFDMNVDDGTSKSGENYMTLNYDRIVPLLVECIKELKNEIKKLKEDK